MHGHDRRAIGIQTRMQTATQDNALSADIIHACYGYRYFSSPVAALGIRNSMKGSDASLGMRFRDLGAR